MPRKDAVMAQAGSISAQAQQDLGNDGIERYELPRTLVTKIARSAIPENAKMQKESVLALVKGSTVFINYLVATAHDVAVSKQHKSISASDVLKALETIQFGDLLPVLSEELTVYRELAKTDKSRRGTAKTTPFPNAVISAAVKKGGKGKAVNGKGKQADANAMDVDNPDGEDTAGEDGDGAEGDEDNENEVDEDEGDDEGGEEPDDRVALEEEELNLVKRDIESARYVGTEAESAPPS